MGQKTILAVDDAATIRQVIRGTLEEAGYNVIVASNGKEALQCLLKHKVHMLVTDINMPEVDGITLTKAVKSKKEFRFLPVVCLTAEDSQTFIPKAKEAGACAWIDKPFTPAEVLSTVKRLMPA